MLLGLLVLAPALAGYGDAVDGYPSLAERGVHLWTNAVRVDPEAFRQDYLAGGCSFDQFATAEQTPTHPLLYSPDLNEAARYHTEDMAAHHFLDHDSSDGTSFAARLARYYPSPEVGENVANAPGWSGREVVTKAWMCSTTGHRANIMRTAWEELGTGAVAPYYTQDFGTRGAASRGMAMGFHDAAAAPGDMVAFYVDHHSEVGTPPDVVALYLDGHPTPMDLLYGTDTSGIWYAAELPDASWGSCHTYWFRAVTGELDVRFPEEGSYGFGDCLWDDPEAMWVDGQAGWDVGAEDACGCRTGSGGIGGWPLVGLLWLGLWRRRRR